MNEKEFDSIIKQVNKEQNIEKLADSYEDFCMHFSCKPDREEYPYPKDGTVIDEDKSVKWNREEVKRQRTAFENRIKELNRWKNILCHQYEVKLTTLLGENYGITCDESSRIWDYAYEEGHGNSIRNVIAVYSDVVDLYVDLLVLHGKENKK